MASAAEIKKIRTKKLKSIQDAGFLAYPLDGKRTHSVKLALSDFSKLTKSKKEIILAGRLMAIRVHGALTFGGLRDSSGDIQISLKDESLGEKGYNFFLDHFDIGDFVEVRGEMYKTKRGEKTLDVTGYKMLAKSLLPLPEKWHGLKDTDERFRKRYLDLLFNPQIREKFELKSKIVSEMRKFLEAEGFLEVETPILQNIYGGATARPFKTKINAFDMEMYLRIAPELYLKRLIVGGFEKVYEIGRLFRNEGVDRSHNPEFTSLELYWAYADYKDLMKLIEKMFATIIKNIFSKLEIQYEGEKLSFKTPYSRIEYGDLFLKHTKIKLKEINETALKEEAKKLGVKNLKGDKAQIADEIFKIVIRPKIIAPTFVIHYPVDAFPLSKPLDGDQEKSASFQFICAGIEIVKAFSELNDPILQKERLQSQEQVFKDGFDEAQRMDQDFIDALEYGMPPTAGLGLGVERLVMILTNSHSAREVILFPTMKPKK